MIKERAKKLDEIKQSIKVIKVSQLRRELRTKMNVCLQYECVLLEPRQHNTCLEVLELILRFLKNLPNVVDNQTNTSPTSSSCTACEIFAQSSLVTAQSFIYTRKQAPSTKREHLMAR